MRVADVVAIKNPGQLHSKLRRSRGSICPWLELLHSLHRFTFEGEAMAFRTGR